jgi:hypothetical protein
MTQAQKTAKAKFKQAIAYRQKTGVSLKEAFAHIYGKKKVGAVKKKSAPKKKTAKKVAKNKIVKKKVVKKKYSLNKKKDKLYSAKKPGKRVSKTGKTYYESRENRSDKGKLLGIGKIYSSNIIKKLERSIDELNMANNQIELHRGNLKMGIKDLFTKKLNQDLVKKNMKLKKELTTHIKELKKLI